MHARAFPVAVVFVGVVVVLTSAPAAQAAPGPTACAGVVDPTFGVAGKVLTDFSGTGSTDVANAVVGDDGTIVVAGSSDARGSRDFALARYRRDGSLDPTFGVGGLVLTDFSGTGSYEAAQALAAQPDGRLVAAGFSVATGVETFALARYNRDGSLDTTFGVGGKVSTDVRGGVAGGSSYVSAVLVQPDGKIVAAGSSAVHMLSDFALARYNRDGRLDPSFGTGGIVLTDISGAGSQDEISAATLQRDGRIVAAGYSNTAGHSQFALARYNRNGALDAAFGAGGTVLTDFGTSTSVARAVAVQRNGAIVAAGYAAIGVGNYDAALARYHRDGSPDPAFGTGGTVLTDFTGTGGYDQANAVAVRRDGRILVAGQSLTLGGTRFVLARYTPNGGLDPTFATGGTVFVDFGGMVDSANAMTLQRNGKVVLAGLSNAAGSYDFALTRVRSDCPDERAPVSPTNAPR